MSEINCNCDNVGGGGCKYHSVLKAMFTVLTKLGFESKLEGVKLTLYLLFIILGYLKRLLVKPELEKEFLDSLARLVSLVPNNETNNENNGDPTNNQGEDVRSSIAVVIKYLLTVIEHLPTSEGLFPESYKVYQSCVELFETLRVSMWKPKALL
jgi:hypothetical protein